MIRENGSDFRSLVLYFCDCSRQRANSFGDELSVSAVYIQMHTAIMHCSGHFPDLS